MASLTKIGYANSPKKDGIERRILHQAKAYTEIMRSSCNYPSIIIPSVVIEDIVVLCAIDKALRYSRCTVFE